uniref:DUF1475 domain-containing protein n=1 Tax=Cyanothece sp. (strain PCC 7425 / ATCC 29141) TaxID=395961 RepID=B8HWP5_CYAP4
MTAFRIFLIGLLTILMAYTGIVIANHGLGLLNIFFGDMAVMGWPGQFNLDFMLMLTLSALWVAWRHQFSSIGILLSMLALVGGSLFLTIYLLILSWQTNGDIKQLLLGMGRVQEGSNGT